MKTLKYLHAGLHWARSRPLHSLLAVLHGCRPTVKKPGWITTECVGVKVNQEVWIVEAQVVEFDCYKSQTTNMSTANPVGWLVVWISRILIVELPLLLEQLQNSVGCFMIFSFKSLDAFIERTRLVVQSWSMQLKTVAITDCASKLSLLQV